MNSSIKRSMAVAAPLALTAILAAAPQASAGLVDGTLNNVHVLDSINLFASVNSDIETSNGNARVRAAKPAAMCEATITATDPDGAAGTASIALPAGRAVTELDIPDQASGTHWGVGDTDHLAGQIACSDAQTGDLLGMVAIDEDDVAG